MKTNPTNLEKKLKLKLTDSNILIKSLTHKSYDSKNNNEKIEVAISQQSEGTRVMKKIPLQVKATSNQ